MADRDLGGGDQECGGVINLDGQAILERFPGLHNCRDRRMFLALAGAADSMLNPLGLGGFTLLHVLSDENEHPPRACRPFDASRKGTVLGEGAAFVVLETLNRAATRGAGICAEVAGYGSSMDAYDIPVHTVKSMTGHTIAAGGAVEAVAAALAMHKRSAAAEGSCVGGGYGEQILADLYPCPKLIALCTANDPRTKSEVVEKPEKKSVRTQILAAIATGCGEPSRRPSHKSPDYPSFHTTQVAPPHEVADDF